MTSPGQKLIESDAEADFFGRADQDAIDEELVALAHGPNPLIPLILLLLAAFAAFLIKQYWNDALYALESEDPTEIGDVFDWPTQFPRDDEGQQQLPANQYVKLRGVTQRRAVIGHNGYAKLAGVPVFAEVDPSVLNERSDTARTYGQMLEFGGDRYVVEKPGRLVPMDVLPVRYQHIARYLSHVFEMNICGVDLEPDLDRALRAERERQLLDLSERLGHAPSKAEVMQTLGPPCESAWLFQEGLAPKQHRGFLVAWVVAWGVLATAIGFLIVWIQRYRAFYRPDVPTKHNARS